MTAEIAVLNRAAIALAADSAVTIEAGSEEEQKRKVFTSANKIFSLSRTAPVGIMIYGAAELAGTPWETTIKLYRDELGERAFPTLEEYAKDFFSFVSRDRRLFSDDARREFFLATAVVYVQRLRGAIDKAVESAIQDRGKITGLEARDIIRQAGDTDYEEVLAAPAVPSTGSAEAQALLALYGSDLKPYVDDIVGGLPMAKTTRRRLDELLALTVLRFPPGFQWTRLTGIVVAGFGADEAFPKLLEYQQEGIAGDRLKYREWDRMEVDRTGAGSGIAPFASHDMVYRFMEGVDPKYQDALEESFRSVLEAYPALVLDEVPGLSVADRDSILSRFMQRVPVVIDRARANLAKYRDETFAIPITNMIDMLPKEELADVAEALVNLTSFKLRVSLEAETVGGPIDVAVISRGDGFVWIKRKHYFPAELNRHYFARRDGRAP